LINITGEDGFITIRFVLNDQGETGRFQIEQMNTAYDSIAYGSQLILRILEEVTKYPWTPAMIESEAYDCALFLIFKIESNKLVDVYV
jgi:hypothetical protein